MSYITGPYVIETKGTVCLNFSNTLTQNVLTAKLKHIPISVKIK